MADARDSGWEHRSTALGHFQISTPEEQTLALVGDLDADGVDEPVIGGRHAGPALVWLRRGGGGYTQHLIESERIDIEAGGVLYDVDGDGALDIVAGEDWSGDRLFWWENPHPHHDPRVPWKRHEIKVGGGKQHHDQIFGDIDGDGRDELVYWNQGAARLFMARIPADPRAGPWISVPILEGRGEGLALGDIDGDGRLELLAGGRWLKHAGGDRFTAHVIDPAQRDSRVAVGDLDGDGRLEVVMVPADGVGPLRWYACQGDPADGRAWVAHDLLQRDVVHGHSLAVADFDGDGALDIFCAEMRTWSRRDGRWHDDHPESRMWLLRGDGRGGFSETVIASGFGVHEAKIGDLDGDGRPDIFAKSYQWETPRADIWLNRLRAH